MERRLLNTCVLVLVLLQVRWRCGSAAPTGCDLDNTLNLTKLLTYEVEQLLAKYLDVYALEKQKISANVTLVSGSAPSEWLQDVLVKSRRFQSQLKEVTKLEAERLSANASIQHDLSTVTGRLSFLSDKIRNILSVFGVVPTAPPPPPQPTLDYVYDIKVYGRGVIVALSEWAGQVSEVLPEAKKVCDITAGR